MYDPLNCAWCKLYNNKKDQTNCNHDLYCDQCGAAITITIENLFYCKSCFEIKKGSDEL